MLVAEKSGDLGVPADGSTPRARLESLDAARGLLRGWGPDVLAISICAVVLPLLIAAHYHSLGAPNADDWAYDLSVFHLASHGSLNLYHWGPSNLVGQLVLALPVVWLFGEHIWALNAWTCVIGFSGLLALDYLGRALGLSRRAALFACAMLGLGPMWAALSTSFMLDIPALAFMTIALAVAASDHRTDRLVTPRSLIALFLAAVAFSIRDETIVVLGAIAWCRLWRSGRPTLRRSLPWLGITGVLGSVLVAFQLWRLGIPSTGHGSPTIGPAVQWYEDMWLIPLASLMLAPVAAAVGPVRVVRCALTTQRQWTFVAWTVLPGLPLIAFISRALLLMALSGPGSPRGINQLIIHPLNVFFETWGATAGPPAGIVFVLGLLSIASTAVLVALGVLAADAVIRKRRSGPTSPDQAGYITGMLVATVVGSWATFAVGIKWNLQAWDRYALPLVEFIPLLALYARKAIVPASPRPWSRTPAVALLGLQAALGTLGAIAVDGFVGSEWTYSNQFAATVRPVPAQLIYTYWAWTALHNQYMDYSDGQYTMGKGYQPCFVQERLAPGARSTALDVRRTGSWVETFVFAMVPTPGSQQRSVCTPTGPPPA